MQNVNDVLIAIRRVIRATDLHSRHLTKTAGLTGPQLLILTNLGNHNEMTIGELAKELSQATITNIVDRLEARQLLKRQRAKNDKRKVLTYLTTNGRKMLKNAPTPLQEHFVEQFEKLNDWEQSMIISSLQRVATMMDASDLDVAPVLAIGELDRNSHENQ